MEVIRTMRPLRAIDRKDAFNDKKRKEGKKEIKKKRVLEKEISQIAERDKHEL